MNDFVMAFKMALLANRKVAITFKTEEEVKVAFPKLVKDLEDYVNSKDYLILMAKEMEEKTNSTKHYQQSKPENK